MAITGKRGSSSSQPNIEAVSVNGSMWVVDVQEIDGQPTVFVKTGGTYYIPQEVNVGPPGCTRMVLWQYRGDTIIDPVPDNVLEAIRKVSEAAGIESPSTYQTAETGKVAERTEKQNFIG